MGRQIIADIIGITDILSQKCRYIVHFKNRHGPSLFTRSPMLGINERMGLKLFGRKIIFEVFQPM